MLVITKKKNSSKRNKKGKRSEVKKCKTKTPKINR